MKLLNKKTLLISTIVFACLAILFTILVKFVDVRELFLLDFKTGEEIDKTVLVGFSGMNESFKDLIKTNPTCYKVSDFLGYLSFFPCVVFLIIGLYQWITRKSLRKVNVDLFILLGIYIITLILYFTFRFIKINYRPTLIDGELEQSFPSSHTMLAFITMVTFMMEMRYFIKKKPYLMILDLICLILLVTLFITRILSGAHWLSDIMGGILYSLTIISLFGLGLSFVKSKLKENN